MLPEIFINNKSLQLGPDTVVVQTFQANNLERPDQIQADYSNRFEVPATGPNREALEFAEEVSSQAETPYRKLDARILAEGVEVVPYGIASLDESQKGKYVLQVISGNKNFFATLGEKSIRDLNLAEFDHDWTASNVINSRGHGYAQGYVYDIIHRGKEGQEASARWCDLYPSTFVRVLWDKIFKDAGFAYEWSREDEGLFDKLLLPAVTPPKLEDGYREGREIFVSRNNLEIGRSKHGSGASDGEKDAWVIGYDKTGPEPFFVGDAGRWSGDTYTADGHYYVDVLASIGVSGFAIFSVCAVKLQLLKNGEVYREIETKFENTNIITAKKITGFILLDEQKILLQPGDTIQMRAAVRKVTQAASFDVRVSVPDGQGLDIQVRADFAPGGRVRLNSWLPEISQKEFVKSFIFLYGLMMQTDSYTQTIRINPFSDLLKRLPFALDWSAKLTTEPAPVTRYAFGSFAQRNYIRYAGDKEDEQARFADGVLLVENQKLEAEKDIITLPFAATRTEAGLPFIEMFNGKQVQQKQTDGSIKLVTEYDEVEAAPRLLIRQDTEMPYTYLTEDNLPIELPDGGRPVSRFLPELHLKNWIVPRHYDAYQAILDHTKFVKAYLYLTPADIANLDFAVPIWLDYFGAYFYLNQVVQWRAGRACECELVRL